jgi:hypothetical protein
MNMREEAIVFPVVASNGQAMALLVQFGRCSIKNCRDGKKF